MCCWSKNCRRLPMRMRTDAAAGPIAPITPTAPASLRKDPRNPIPIAIALAAGALNVFAFAPFGLWPLQIGCAALLFALVMQAPSVRRAAVLGWLYSFAWTCGGVWWLYISLHDMGGLPAVITILAIALLALGLGLIVGAATGGARWLQRRHATAAPVTLLMTLPALWMLAEWTRSWIFTGFPWLSTGLAHTGSPLAGFAPVIGVYGISLVAAVIAAALALAALHLWDARTSMAHGSPTRASRFLLPSILILLPLAGGQALRGIDWTHPLGKPITVRLLQGNIPQAMKFDGATLGQTLGLYDALITQAPADLIATPETAVPVLRQELPPDYLQRISDYATHSGSHVLVGIPLSDGPGLYTNGLIVLDPAPPGVTALPVPIASVAPEYRYDKHHLVPFGEFIPPGFRWFVDMMQIPLGDQTRGALLQPPFQVKDQWILPNICYEDLFGEEIAAQIRDRVWHDLPPPSMLLNISNIAWFGDSIALPQHLQISQMRTLETGLPMLRATNTGATAIIGVHGRVQAQLAPYTRGVLAASVQGHAGMTPYVRLGNGTAVNLALLLIIAAAASARLRRRWPRA
jgi:apolipoprotein N-acyltransferase